MQKSYQYQRIHISLRFTEANLKPDKDRLAVKFVKKQTHNGAQEVAIKIWQQGLQTRIFWVDKIFQNLGPSINHNTLTLYVECDEAFEVQRSFLQDNLYEKE